MVRGFLVLSSALTLLTLAACAKPASRSIATSSKSNSGIIGGTDATGTEDFAQTVVLLFDVKLQATCTASIVSDSLLVTAAHCLVNSPQDLRIIFGTSRYDLDHRIVRAVDAYKTSPIWPFRNNEELNSGDIAMVKFSGGLPPGYKPAQILADASALQDDTTVILAGYGQSNGVEHDGGGILRSVEVRIQNANYTESEVLLNQTEGKGACHGDSGGPAYVRVNGQLMLWGVTNRGVNDPQNHCSEQSAYASIPYYKEWLQATAHDLTNEALL